MRIESWGHALFAATMIGLGIVGLSMGGFTPTWSGVPAGVPARQALAYVCAVISLLCGIGLLFERTALPAGRVLLASLVLWLVLVRLPRFFVAPAAIDTWWSPGDSGVMIAATWILCVWFAADRGAHGFRLPRVLYGLALLPFGLAHFANLKGTESLVPSWLPGHVAWAYFTGGAFIVAGVAVVTGVFGRLAATLSALQVGLFTVLVWVPVVIAGKANTGQWMELIESVALTAGAWVVAESYRGTPWLAVAKLRVPAVAAQPAR